MSPFTLFQIAGSLMGSSHEKVVIAEETLLIIAETDALEIPKAFVVFLWCFRYLNLDTRYMRLNTKKED